MAAATSHSMSPHLASYLLFFGTTKSLEHQQQQSLQSLYPNYRANDFKHRHESTTTAPSATDYTDASLTFGIESLLPDLKTGARASAARRRRERRHSTATERKKPRTSFTKSQIATLEECFADHKYLASGDRLQLSRRLSMTDTQVKTWFQNRRTKWRRQEAEEKEHSRTSNSIHFAYSGTSINASAREHCLYNNGIR